MNSTLEEDLRELNAALLVSSVHQHELTERAKQAEIAAARLAAIVTSSDDAIISKNLDGIITSWNKGAERLFGYTAKEAIGKSMAFLIPPGRGNEEPRILECLRRGETIERFETVRQCKNGSLVEVSLTVSPIRDADGSIIGGAKIARDITDSKRVELQLRRNAETISKLVEQSPYGIYIVDSEFRIAQVSSGAQAVFRNVQPLVGRDFEEAMRILWPEPFAGEVIHIFRRTLETGEPYVAPSLTEHRHDVDAVESYEWQTQRVTLPDGQFGVVCYFFDATLLRKAEVALRESEERFHTLADNMAQFAWTADAKGEVNWYNQRWYDYTGATLEEMQGSGWKRVHHPDHIERVVQRLQQSWDTGEEWEDTFPLRGKGGQYRWFLSRSRPIRDDKGHVIRWFGTNTDITDQREMQDKIAEQAELLTREAHHKDEFLATLAHELRNPLAPIRNAVQFLDLAGIGGPEAITAKEVISRQVAVMVRLVDDLLDVSRISRNKLDLRKQRVELAGIMENAVESSRPLIEQCGHELTVDLPPQSIALDADPVRLAQVFSNLLNNAAKYTKRGGHIWLAALREGNDAVVRVRDNGTGISAEMLTRIFDMFTQVDRSLGQSQGGLGIGLTLARRLVEMHDGSIEARSAGVDQGSEFVVRLPLPVAQQQEPRVASVAPRVQTLSGYRILVVDDNKDSADSLAMVLRRQDNDLRIAYDGLEAVKAADAFRPELLLLDIGLPKLNGYEVARRIRLQQWGQDMILVALTGWGQAEDRRRSHEAGFDLHIVKPVELAALEQLLVRLDTKQE